MVTYLIVLFVIVAILFGSTAAGFLALRLVLWIVIILGVLSLFGFGFYQWRSPIIISSISNTISYLAV
jgi:NADH:ubiquinone oxidoreductase subunit 6 (subunit J)